MAEKKRTNEVNSYLQALANFKRDVKRLHPRPEDQLAVFIRASEDMKQNAQQLSEKLQAAAAAFVNSRKNEWDEFLAKELEAHKE